MKKLLFVIIILWSIGLTAQGEAANWYFGNEASIRFDQGGITVLNNSVLNTTEGSATISDPGGNLLFYTDGSTVYNRNHEMMENGFGLLGDNSSSQSAIIVPKPNDINIYYIFTVDAEESNNPAGLNYSEVDISLDNGLGAVTQKNINLLERSAEKVSVVLRDCFDGSLWVVSFSSEDGTTTNFNTYHAFQVNNTGVVTTPISSIFNTLNIDNGRGYLKFSPDGNRLASANFIAGTVNLYDFDALSGIVSNQQELIINNISNLPYGIEFSPNSQLLYVNSAFSTGFGINSRNPLDHTTVLVQFNLNAANIQASEFILDDRVLFRGALQLGIDGRIYRALSSTFFEGSQFLGVINNPNVIGAGANYQHNAIDLSPNLSMQGLPPFDQSLFVNRIDIIRNGISATRLDLCEGESFTLIGDDIAGATYTWSRDGIVLTGETTFELLISQGGFEDGFYELVINPNNGGCPIIGQALVVISPAPEAFDTTIVQCDEDGIVGGFNTFDLASSIAEVTGGIANRTVQFYPTLLDAQTPNTAAEITDTIIITDDLTQTFFARISITTASSGCFSIAEISLDATLAMGNNTSLEECDTDGTLDGFFTFNLPDANQNISSAPNLTFTYYLTVNQAILSQSPLPNNFTNTIADNQTVFVRVENDEGCFSINEIELTVTTLDIVETDEEIMYCELQFPQTITLSSDVPEDEIDDFTFLWSTGETTPEIEVNTIGVFMVVADNLNTCSQFLKTITIIPTDIDTTETEENVTYCELQFPQTISLSTDVQEDEVDDFSFLWSTGETTPEIEINEIGVFTVMADNSETCSRFLKTITVTPTNINTTQTEEELNFCEFNFPETVILNSGISTNEIDNFTFLWSTGEETPEIEVNDIGVFSVTATNAQSCSTITRTITINIALTTTIEDTIDIDINDGNQNNNSVTINISGSGDYEYAIDDINGPYQNNNRFENVEPGFHTIFIRDLTNCQVAEREISVIGFLRFFTPNGDSYFDTWQVIGLSANFQPRSTIFIFDRYGKLLKQLDPLGSGWDGTYNGRNMPTNDYWYRVTLEDGRLFRGHFTLKR